MPSRNNRGVFLNAALKFKNREIELGCTDNSGNYSLLNKMDVESIKGVHTTKDAVSIMKHYVKPVFGGLATAVAINIVVFFTADERVIGPTEMFFCFLGLCVGAIALNTIIFFFSVSVTPLSKIVIETEAKKQFIFFVEQVCFENVVKTMKSKGINVGIS